MNESMAIIMELTDMISELTNSIKVHHRKPTKLELNYVNQQIYRQSMVLYPIYDQLRTSINAIRLSIFSQRLETVVALQELCEYLAENPRYVRINLQFALVPCRALEFDSMPTMFSQLRAYQNKLEDFHAQLNFIARPFSVEESNKGLVSQLIKEHIRMRDPFSSYIPYIEEHQILARFLLSAASPFNIRQAKGLKEQQLPGLLASASAAVASWLGLKPTQTPSLDVVKIAVCRLLFEHFNLFAWPAGVSSGALQAHVAALAGSPISALGVTADQVAPELLALSSDELFTAKTVISSAKGHLLAALFMSCPVDAAYEVHRVALGLAAMLSEARAETLERCQRFDDLFGAWKCAIVAAQIPEPDQLFAWISRWKHLEVMPPLLVESIRVPRSVIKGMLKEALATRPDPAL
jgi:hypothetical protein